MLYLAGLLRKEVSEGIEGEELVPYFNEERKKKRRSGRGEVSVGERVQVLILTVNGDR